MRFDNEAFGSVVSDVMGERLAQNDKWGEQNHRPSEWAGILMEEVGELAQEINEFTFSELKFEDAETDNMRAEAVQVAAVAMAFIECGDRNGWWSNPAEPSAHSQSEDSGSDSSQSDNEGSVE